MKKNNLISIFAIIVSIASISVMLALIISKFLKPKYAVKKSSPLTKDITYNDISEEDLTQDSNLGCDCECPDEIDNSEESQLLDTQSPNESQTDVEEDPSNTAQ